MIAPDWLRRLPARELFDSHAIAHHAAEHGHAAPTLAEVEEARRLRKEYRRTLPTRRARHGRAPEQVTD